MLTLGIESSCDETSAAVVRAGREILSNVILSQTIHSKFGGVVPEVASRAHLKTIVPIYRSALEEAGVDLDRIELIACTIGPGLVGPLLVGLSFGKGLALATGKPFVAVHHIEGHLAANILEHHDLDSHHLTLIVSGGHTMLVEVKSFGHYEILGRTKDDAAGEAFDKVAKLMGLGYPGGARLDQLAQSGKRDYVRFPRALKAEPGYRFSYSGLKTAVALYLEKLDSEEFEAHKADIAASFQEAAVEVLVKKTVRAAREKGIRHVTLSGGVAANSRLRETMSEALKRYQMTLYYPSLNLCTDNAAMIAAAGYFRYKEHGPSEPVVNAVPYLDLADW
ncbi:MAG TPA: tRNA (adenosine(37)-N6)-threonylcarbamoyltransferase complex transferase subunit TsaD [candidate division Zixibacteria bacterium]|nr:tRNA (adenosine(37)-N6)-threonylcarbamoyltransferase complex transferase subunit TsaD [candidate division Zixibacteria bacterium]